MKQKIARQWQEFCLLTRSVPPLLLALFVLCVFAMNLLANKSIDFGVDWLVLDCGTLLSWFAFLTMDVLTKHFGAKASIQISLLAILINLAMCLVFFAASCIAGTWSVASGSTDSINGALNATIGGTWYVVVGSTVAFACSSVINNLVNAGIGKLTKNSNGFGAYALRTYLSTAVGQFVDNFVFALLVGHFFFDWTVVQCLVCATTTMVAELLLEIIFSPLGFKLCKRWQTNNVGKEYFEFRQRAKEISTTTH